MRIVRPSMTVGVEQRLSYLNPLHPASLPGELLQDEINVSTVDTLISASNIGPLLVNRVSGRADTLRGTAGGGNDSSLEEQTLLAHRSPDNEYRSSQEQRSDLHTPLSRANRMVSLALTPTCGGGGEVPPGCTHAAMSNHTRIPQPTPTGITFGKVM